MYEPRRAEVGDDERVRAERVKLLSAGEHIAYFAVMYEDIERYVCLHAVIPAFAECLPQCVALEVLRHHPCVERGRAEIHGVGSGGYRGVERFRGSGGREQLGERLSCCFHVLCFPFAERRVYRTARSSVIKFLIFLKPIEIFVLTGYNIYYNTNPAIWE